MNRAEALPQYLASLAAFIKEFGHANVPRTYEAEPTLAAWVRMVRSSWREGRLHASHIQRLTEAGFCFAPLEAAWQEQFEKLVQYRKAQGHAQVPRDYEDRQLAIWVMHQRDHFKKEQLTEEQVKLLKSVYFVFDPQGHQWEQNLDRLRTFKNKWKHACVPRRYAEDTKLADFAAEMRKRFKARQLSEKQVSDLIEIEFVFDPLDADWSQKLSEYVAWRATSDGSTLPPRRVNGKPVSAYEWCRVQLRNLQEGRIPAERVARLKQAGFPVPA